MGAPQSDEDELVAEDSDGGKSKEEGDEDEEKKKEKEKEKKEQEKATKEKEEKEISNAEQFRIESLSVPKYKAWPFYSGLKTSHEFQNGV